MMHTALATSPHLLRRRLWKMGSLPGVLLIAFAIANLFVSREKAVTREMLVLLAAIVVWIACISPA